jgi:iron complex transport system substrate-binding protein
MPVSCGHAWPFPASRPLPQARCPPFPFPFPFPFPLPHTSNSMRVVSHTCSNTEIVCALDCAHHLVGVDADSDYPREVVAALPALGRDLELDVTRVRQLRPDLVLTSLTVPGHERTVQALQDAGLRTLVVDPQSLQDVYASIETIAAALDVADRGQALVRRMRAAMQPIPALRRPAVLIEWWPKPVIVPGARSWATDVLHLAGGRNPWYAHDVKSLPVTTAQVCAAAPDAVVMSWCGVQPAKYRAQVVRRRSGWTQVPAVARDRIYPVSEAWLGRPGPRLVHGYQALRKLVAACAADDTG